MKPIRCPVIRAIKLAARNPRNLEGRSKESSATRSVHGNNGLCIFISDLVGYRVAAPALKQAFDDALSTHARKFAGGEEVRGVRWKTRKGATDYHFATLRDRCIDRKSVV